MTHRCTKFTTLLAAIILAGCTFQSPQLNRAMALLGQQQSIDDFIADGVWQMSWNGEQMPAWSMQQGVGGVFVANNRTELGFNGFFFNRATRLPGVNGLLEINLVNPDAPAMEFHVEGALVGRFPCNPYITQTLENGNTQWTLPCGNDTFRFSNRLVVTAEGRIVSLNFLLHPGFAPVTLTRR